MIDKLIRFLHALSKLPGCRWALRLIDAWRAQERRRLGVRIQVHGAMRKVKNVHKTGADLLGIKSGGGLGEARHAAPGAVEAGTTIILPRPGGRAVPRTAEEARQEPIVELDAPALPIRGSGLNPLVDAAAELFCLVGRIRTTPACARADALRGRMADKVAAFDRAARVAGAANEQVVAARYAVCTLLDEMALSTPWGAESQWSRHSLLSQFHGETWGGEKFFLMVERILTEPARHLSLLEFMYVCIALGLQGKWRVLEGGRERLKAIQDNLYRTIRGVRGDFERELAPRWRGAPDVRNRLARFVPLWAVASFAAVALLVAYVGFAWNLARTADPVYGRLARIGQDQAMVVAMAPLPRTLTLREVLAADITAGLLEVIEQARGSTVEIRGDGLFPSGSAEIDPRHAPLIQRIGDALNQFPGRVLVTGHTDNQPLAVSRRVRFPTNWDLSQARAEAVSALLNGRLTETARIRAEGRGESEPKVANDSPQHRA
ncbi:MAG: type IVB secretion system protein IcmH/DotU, partial [Rhodocyclaceae bacterium]